MKLIFALIRLWFQCLFGILILMLLIPFGPAILLGVITKALGYDELIGFTIGFFLQFLGYSIAVLDEEGYFSK